MNKNIIYLLAFSTLLVGRNNAVRVYNIENNDKRIILESNFTESEYYNGIKTCEEVQHLAL